MDKYFGTVPRHLDTYSGAQASQLLWNMGGIMILCHYPKAVHVSRYLRFRRGRWEYVREHCRRYPRR